MVKSKLVIIKFLLCFDTSQDGHYLDHYFTCHFIIEVFGLRLSDKKRKKQRILHGPQ